MSSGHSPQGPATATICGKLNRSGGVFSPLAGDSRVGFLRFTGRVNATYRYDIWVVTVPSAYDGTTTLAATQITNSLNAHNLVQAEHVDWSPDALWFAFDAYPVSLNSSLNIYKIPSDGSSKEVNLTPSKSVGYVLSQWRP